MKRLLGYNNYFDKVQLVDEKIDFITTVHSKLLKVEVLVNESGNICAI